MRLFPNMINKYYIFKLSAKQGKWQENCLIMRQKYVKLLKIFYFLRMQTAEGENINEIM